MNPKPTIELLPQKPAARRESATELLVLARITPPNLEPSRERPSLNLGLVLDRSGSMAGEKLDAAKRAATFLVRQLAATDRVAVTIYDDEVQTIVASTLAGDKTAIVRAIERVQTAGCTALHDGWVEGGTQVARHLDAKWLNRVLLLTDGLANRGETNADRIASDVKGLAGRGISTTTLGVGDDFNEDLLKAMADAGDGNYYFIEGASDLERIFAVELSGLMATIGNKVSLGLEPQNGAKIVDVLSDLPQTEFGRLMLSNLIAGNPLEVVFKLEIPALEQESDVCFSRLAWDAPESREREVLREALSLKAVSDAEWEAMPSDTRVTDAAARLEVARQRDKIAAMLDDGDVAGASEGVKAAREFSTRYLAAPAAMSEEMAAFDELEADIKAGEAGLASKKAKYSGHLRRRSQQS